MNTRKRLPLRLTRRQRAVVKRALAAMAAFPHEQSDRAYTPDALPVISAGVLFAVPTAAGFAALHELACRLEARTHDPAARSVARRIRAVYQIPGGGAKDGSA